MDVHVSVVYAFSFRLLPAVFQYTLVIRGYIYWSKFAWIIKQVRCGFSKMPKKASPIPEIPKILKERTILYFSKELKPFLCLLSGSAPELLLTISCSLCPSAMPSNVTNFISCVDIYNSVPLCMVGSSFDHYHVINWLGAWNLNLHDLTELKLKAKSLPLTF